MTTTTTGTAAQRRMTRCVDCGQRFDQNDDEARCPASDGTAFHRSAADARNDDVYGEANR